MAATILPRVTESPPTARGGHRLSIGLILAAWFALVVGLGAIDAFVGPPGKPPIAIAAGIAVPLLVFFAWLSLSRSFRDFVLSADLQFVAGLQAWRWAGLGFLFLYAYHILPPFFALVAGFGDMAVGFAAPWMIVGLRRHADFSASPAFIRWNVLGILDLVVAVTLGTLGTVLATGAAGEITTAPMATLPLLVIPGFLVPLFLMLHTTALLQSRQRLRARS